MASALVAFMGCSSDTAVFHIGGGNVSFEMPSGFEVSTMNPIDGNLQNYLNNDISVAIEYGETASRLIEQDPVIHVIPKDFHKAYQKLEGVHYIHSTNFDIDSLRLQNTDWYAVTMWSSLKVTYPRRGRGLGYYGFFLDSNGETDNPEPMSCVIRTSMQGFSQDYFELLLDILNSITFKGISIEAVSLDSRIESTP